MKGLVVLLGSVVLSFPVAHADTIYYSSCRGGGGVPLVDITPSFKAPKHLLHTDGLVKNFVFWQKKNQLVYRNNSDELRVLDIAGGKDTEVAEGLQYPPARFADSAERFIVTQNDPWVLDLAGQALAWHQLSTEAVKPIFSSDGALYALEGRDFSTFDRLDFVRYQDGDVDRFSCDLPSDSAGEAFHLGEGHSYPYVFLYSTSEVGSGQQRLTLYDLKIRRGLFQKFACKLEPVKTYSMAMPAPVSDVYRFSPDEYAVRLENPNRPILWDSPNDCTYFDFTGRYPIIANTNEPVILTWKRGEGVGLTYLNEKKKVTLLAQEAMNTVNTNDLWLSDDGKTLLVGERPDNDSARMVYDVDLETTVTR